jgi:hypothetical protein
MQKKIINNFLSVKQRVCWVSLHSNTGSKTAGPLARSELCPPKVCSFSKNGRTWPSNNMALCRRLLLLANVFGTSGKRELGRICRYHSFGDGGNTHSLGEMLFGVTLFGGFCASQIEPILATQREHWAPCKCKNDPLRAVFPYPGSGR